MKLINLTRHTVNIFLNGNGDVISLPADYEDKPARVDNKQVLMSNIDGIRVMQTSYLDSESVNLPAPRRDTYYIVSSLVAMSNPDRYDLLSPNSHPDEVVKDRKGKVLGVKSLQCFWRA